MSRALVSRVIYEALVANSTLVALVGETAPGEPRVVRKFQPSGAAERYTWAVYQVTSDVDLARGPDIERDVLFNVWGYSRDDAKANAVVDLARASIFRGEPTVSVGGVDVRWWRFDNWQPEAWWEAEFRMAVAVARFRMGVRVT